MELLLKCFMIAGIREQIPNVYGFTDAYGIYRLNAGIKITLYMELPPCILCLQSIVVSFSNFVMAFYNSGSLPAYAALKYCLKELWQWYTFINGVMVTCHLCVVVCSLSVHWKVSFRE